MTIAALITTIFLLVIPWDTRGQDAEKYLTKLNQAIPHALSSALYWDYTVNYWDPDGWNKSGYELTRKVHDSIGREIDAELWIEKVESDAERAYLVVPSFMVGDCSLTFLFWTDSKNIVFLGTELKPPEFKKKCSRVANFDRIKIPQDWYVTAKRFDQNLAKDMVALRKGLKKMLPYAQSGNKGRQHFFVGPFNQMCSQLNIYWHEERKLLTVIIPPNRDLKAIDVSATRFEDFQEYGLGQPMDERERERSRLYFRNRKVTNCVFDGLLIEVDP